MPDVGLVLERAFTILAYLAKEGESNINGIAKGLGLRPNTVSDYIKKMENLGLVETYTERVVPPEKRVSLSNKGKCIVSCLSES